MEHTESLEAYTHEEFVAWWKTKTESAMHTYAIERRTREAARIEVTRRLKDVLHADSALEERRYEDFVKAIELVGCVSGDSETAHIWEDNLREAVLTRITQMGEDGLWEAQNISTIALRTNELHFSRWHA